MWSLRSRSEVGFKHFTKGGDSRMKLVTLVTNNSINELQIEETQNITTTVYKMLLFEVI